jgi:hypothetical protein
MGNHSQMKYAIIESLRFALYGKRQTPSKEKFYGIRQYRVNEVAVLKLKYMTILSTQERKHETKTFNENVAKKVPTCRLPFPETRSLLNSLFTSTSDWQLK